MTKRIFPLVALVGCGLAAGMTLRDQNAAQATDDQAELKQTVEDAGQSAIDFERGLERYLQKHPHSTQEPQIIKALYQGAQELKDDTRIARYGSRLLEMTPDDTGLLAQVGEALNRLNDRQSSERAFQFGQHLEQLLMAAAKPGATPNESSDADAVRQGLQRKKQLSDALRIQADAAGTLGRTDEAVTFAQRSFDLLPSAGSAQALGRWQARAGHYDAAVEAYADAFSLADTFANHMDDRRKLAEYYRKTHPSEAGLGDIVLRAYDRMTGRAEEQNAQLDRAIPASPSQVALPALDGKPLPISSLKGKVVVLDFWATWCGPCRVQHPLYEQVRERFRDDKNVIFVEVNSDDDRTAVPAFVRQNSWREPVYYDAGLAELLKIRNIPTTVLLDRQGTVYSKLIGFRPETFVDLLTARIHEALQSN